MTLKKYGAVLTAAAMLLCASGCSEIRQTSPYLDEQAAAFANAMVAETTAVTMAATTTAVTTTTMLTGPEYTEVPLNVPLLNIQNVELVYQAEDTELPVAFQAENEKTDYTGSGYVSGLKGELQNTFVFNVEIPASQHYDVSIVVCADEGAECSLFVNNEEIGDIAVESSSRFVCVTVPGIYMESGAATVSIQQKDGDMLLDCLELCNNTSLSPDRQIEAVPCNPDASEEAKELLEFLCSSYGNAVISGQHVSGSSNTEIARIVETTGKYPAIRFADMYQYSSNGGDAETADTVSACLEWSEQGGITGLMWHWFAPIGNAGTLSGSAEFRLSNAVTSEDVADASPAELKVMCKAGAISDECLKLIEDIDAVSEALKELCSEDVPVLWRPLHQAGSGMYWWDSEGSEAYLWLWDLIYERMTGYHDLDNLLWVWSGVDKDYLPDSSQFDIAAADVYCAEGEEFGSGYEPYYALQKMAEGKLIALSECSSLPDVTIAFRDGSVWSYFGLWYEPYLEDEDNAYTDSETLVQIYNSEGVITREDYIEYCRQDKADEAVATTSAE